MDKAVVEIHFVSTDTHPDQIFPFDEVPVGVYTGPLRKIREWEIPSPEEIHDYYVNNLSPAGWAERFNREVLSNIRTYK